MSHSLDEQLEVIKRGVAEIIPEEELIEKLKRSNRKSKPLRVKAGFDPTAPDLHLGHVVLLKKLRDLQDLGHTVVFLIGDFTATIGDPSGRTQERPPLTQKEVLENAKTYEKQVFKILKKELTEVAFNSAWLGNMPASKLLQLAGLETVAQILERDDFHKRYVSGTPITIKEFLYPIIQAYDSVKLHVDIEFGGTDQKFNILLGRDVQKYFGQEPQVAILVPILEGLDGTQKMSKSLGNYVAVEDPPKEMYGKIMSISDTLMWKYYELLSRRTPKEIENVQENLHPMKAKRALAYELVEWFHGVEAAKEAEKDFEIKFSRREFPEDQEVITIPVPVTDEVTAQDLVVRVSGRVKSNSEAKRLIRQGGFSINDEKITDPLAKLPSGRELRARIGKREFLKVILQPHKESS